MPAVPLGVQAYARASAQQPEVRLVNFYIEEDKSGGSRDEVARIQRPGLTRTNSLTYGPVRAIYQSDNQITRQTLVLAGGSLLRMSGGPTKIADLPDDGRTARIEATSLVVGILSAGQFFIWDGKAVTKVRIRDKEDPKATDITLSDLPSIVDVDTLNGYFLLATASGVTYWLVPGEVTVNALAFADAEAKPDGAIAVRRLRDDIYILGRDSIEVWQNTGDADATFQRAPGRLTDRGILHRDTLAIYDNSLVWVGDDGIIYRMSDVPQRISDFGIEERIRNRTGDPSAWVFTTFGHKFYVLRLPGVGTFAYDAATKSWCEFATNDEAVWRPTMGRDTPTGVVCGDETGALYILDPDSSLDDGKPFLRLVTGTIPVPAKPVANTSLSIGVGSDGPAVFQMRYRDPRGEWSEPRIMTARGDGDVLPFWRLGAARTPYRTYEVSTLAPTKVRISGALANESWRV